MFETGSSGTFFDGFVREIFRQHSPWLLAEVLFEKSALCCADNSGGTISMRSGAARPKRSTASMIRSSDWSVIANTRRVTLQFPAQR
jgi:hypothetical protein